MRFGGGSRSNTRIRGRGQDQALAEVKLFLKDCLRDSLRNLLRVVDSLWDRGDKFGSFWEALRAPENARNTRKSNDFEAFGLPEMVRF